MCSWSSVVLMIFHLVAGWWFHNCKIAQEVFIKKTVTRYFREELKQGYVESLFQGRPHGVHLHIKRVLYLFMYSFSPQTRLVDKVIPDNHFGFLPIPYLFILEKLPAFCPHFQFSGACPLHEVLNKVLFASKPSTLIIKNKSFSCFIYRKMPTI